MINTGYWAIIGTIQLLILVYQDYRHNMLVDDRKNYFMMGLTVSLIFVLQPAFWYILTILAFTVALTIYMTKFKVLGEADIKTMSWACYGFGLFGIYKLVAFLVIFAAVTAIYSLLKFGVFKMKKQPAPFYGVILGSFIVAAWAAAVY